MAAKKKTVTKEVGKAKKPFVPPADLNLLPVVKPMPIQVDNSGRSKIDPAIVIEPPLPDPKKYPAQAPALTNTLLANFNVFSPWDMAGLRADNAAKIVQEVLNTINTEIVEHLTFEPDSGLFSFKFEQYPEDIICMIVDKLKEVGWQADYSKEADTVTLLMPLVSVYQGSLNRAPRSTMPPL